MSNNMSKTVKWIFIGIGVSLLTFLTIIIVVLHQFVVGGIPKTTQDISKYEEAISRRSDVCSAFVVFPEGIPNGAINVDFDYYIREAFSSKIEVFLQCQYDVDTYKAEVERLSNTSIQHGGVHIVNYPKRELMKDTKGKFNYEAFIAVENVNGAYEYALLTGENEITYICAIHQQPRKVRFDKKYLPNDYYDTMDKYSIYWKDFEGTQSMYVRPE